MHSSQIQPDRPDTRRALIEPYRLALETAAATCREVADQRLGQPIAPITVTIRTVESGSESVRAEYPTGVVFDVSKPAQLEPPPVGEACLYGLTHEVGHLVVAAIRAGSLPAVVWDEALAHNLAVELFLPGLWAQHGPELWPGGYVDYHIAEGHALLAERTGSPMWDHASALRRMSSDITHITQIRGWRGLADGLRRLDDADLTSLRFSRALERMVRTA
jgi:hypothetical protein